MVTPAVWSGIDMFPLGPSRPSDRMDSYIGPLDQRWSAVETSPFSGVHNPFTTAHASAAILTPISVGDSSFLQARPSPVLSNHSNELDYNPLDDSVARHGLGISAPFQGDFGDSTNLGFSFTPGGDLGYPPGQGYHSPSGNPHKRQRRPTKSSPSMRYSPVRILPHPEGLQRLEQERRHSQTTETPLRELQRPRTATRSRRDPQAEEEDAYVENLRQQNLSWKVVAEMFRERFNKESTEARLQMRMLRRRKSAALWHDADIPLLLKAHEYWQKEKYAIIAAKLQELGASRAYSDQHCESQLRALETGEAEEGGTTSLPHSPDLRKTKRLSLKSNSHKRMRDSEDDL